MFEWRLNLSALVFKQWVADLGFRSNRKPLKWLWLIPRSIKLSTVRFSVGSK